METGPILPVDPKERKVSFILALPVTGLLLLHANP